LSPLDDFINEIIEQASAIIQEDSNTKNQNSEQKKEDFTKDSLVEEEEKVF